MQPIFSSTFSVELKEKKTHQTDRNFVKEQLQNYILLRLNSFPSIQPDFKSESRCVTRSGLRNPTKNIKRGWGGGGGGGGFGYSRNWCLFSKRRVCLENRRLLVRLVSSLNVGIQINTLSACQTLGHPTPCLHHTSRIKSEVKWAFLKANDALQPFQML